MQTYNEALAEGYQLDEFGCHVFKFTDSDGNQYELWFEKLIFEDQHYVALYKNQELMTTKVPIKPGKI